MPRKHGKKITEQEFRDAVREWELANAPEAREAATCVTPHTLSDLQAPPQDFMDPRTTDWMAAFSSIMSEQSAYQTFIVRHAIAARYIEDYNEPPIT